MNEEVAALLREYAELTVITGGDVFRVRNYEKAARSIRGWPSGPSTSCAPRFRPASWS
jgi:DNA polymerase (family 10)